jgi:putative transposase
MNVRKGMIEGECDVSIRKQSALLGISRSGLYYHPRGTDQAELEIMKMIDEQYTNTPFYGIERMTAQLKREGVRIGHNKVRRLMRTMGLEAIYPKPRLSVSCPDHTIYPYLLKGIKVLRPNQVWATDITYIRMMSGFVYLVAIMDWFSRYVISWRISTSLDAQFCIAALEEALSQVRPEIFNSDQGSQFTSHDFTTVLKGAGVRISMDGRGRVFDNIFVERLWRSVKYEEVYIQDYDCVADARHSLGKYFQFYNTSRLHQALGYKTPEEIHYCLK